MKLIHSYIIKKCFLNTGMLLFAFSIIYTVVQAIQELNTVGKGSYNTFAMFVYLGALLPSYIYLLIPLSVLIGVMTTMLGLVKNSEYAIMRTSGLSLGNITRILTSVGVIFAIITLLVGEFIAPEFSQFAKTYKLNKTEEQVSMSLSSGIWSKDGQHDIVNIKGIGANNISHIESIVIFSYLENTQLKKRTVAEYADYDINNKDWLLHNVTTYLYIGNRIIINHYPTLTWRSSIDPSYFKILVASPDDMPAFSLISYIKHLRHNHESTNRHEIAMWNKLLYPISCISMALIAIGFIPNNGRNINLSTKLFAGILIGIAFFFVNKLVGFLAVLYFWNPILSASIPTIILFSIGWIVIMKKES